MEERFKDIEHLIKEADLHHPSIDFSKNVMGQIEALAEQKEMVYRPLISKKTWLIISVVLALIFIALIFLTDEKGSILNRIDLSFLNFENLKNPLSGFTFHKTTLYGILFFAILFFVQIPLLKRRIDRSFSI